MKISFSCVHKFLYVLSYYIAFPLIFPLVNMSDPCCMLWSICCWRPGRDLSLPVGPLQISGNQPPMPIL